MMRLSQIHPERPLRPGRYLLDDFGVLWTPLVPLPFRMVAAVVVLPLGEMTRRQHAEQATAMTPASTDDVGAVAIPTDNSVEGPVEILGTMRTLPSVTAPPQHIAEKLMRSMARRDEPIAIRGFQSLIEADDDVAEVAIEFDAKLKAVQARRAKQTPAQPATAIDGKHIAAVYRAKPMKAAPKPKIPTVRALTREECWQCGIPGARGCEHQLPFEESSRS